MQINNEHFYLNELELIMSDFLNKHDVGDDAGYLPENVTELMAAAAFNVLKTVKDCNNYFDHEKSTLT